MADGRKERAKKGWETRRARLRVVTPQEAEKVYGKAGIFDRAPPYHLQGWWPKLLRWLLRSG